MNIYDTLDKLNINYQKIMHKPIFTVEEAHSLKLSIPGIGCKNLFLTNHKGSYYLILLEDFKKANLKELASITNSSHLTFASEEELKSILNLEKGSVTPLGIINDINNRTFIIIDSALQDKTILCHSYTNTETISISFTDLIKFIEYAKHNYLVTKL